MSLRDKVNVCRSRPRVTMVSAGNEEQVKTDGNAGE